MEIVILGLFSGAISGAIFGFILPPIFFFILSVFISGVEVLLFLTDSRRNNMYALLFWASVAFLIIGWAVISIKNPEFGLLLNKFILDLLRLASDFLKEVFKILVR